LRLDGQAPPCVPWHGDSDEFQAQFERDYPVREKTIVSAKIILQ
jgi:hypothetical protein